MQHGHLAAECQKTTPPSMPQGTNMADEKPHTPGLQLWACCERQPSLLSDPAEKLFPPSFADTPSSATKLQAQHCALPHSSRHSLPLAPTRHATATQLWAVLVPGSDTAQHPAPLPLHTSDIDPATPRDPLVDRAAPLTCSLSTATAQQHLTIAPVLPWLTPAPPQPPTAGQHQPLHRLPSLYREGPSPSASLPAPGASPAPAHSWTQQEQGAIARAPECVPSSPGLHHSPSPRAKETQTQPGNQRRQLVFICHACNKSRKRACSRAWGPLHFPWDSLADVPRAALIALSVGFWRDGLLGRGGGHQK